MTPIDMNVNIRVMNSVSKRISRTVQMLDPIIRRANPIPVHTADVIEMMNVHWLCSY